MSSRDSWTLFRWRGVPVRIHFTWLFIAVYLVVLFTGQFKALARAAEVAETSMLLPPWAWGVLLTLALFACVLLHEMAHVAVARRGQARVRSITLMMLGGVSEVSEVERPQLEWRMAAAGPLASLVLAALFWVGFRLSHGAPPDVRFGLFYLAQVNLVIGLFNLLPAFPMDGGRILRSLLVRPFGALRATQIAATVGKMVAVAMFVAGLVYAGWWLALIAVFIFLGGEAESRALQARAALRGLRVGDFCSRRLAAVPPTATLADVGQALVEAHADLCLVVAGERPVGMVSAAQVMRVPVRERAELPVTQAMLPPATVAVDEELPAVLRKLDEERLDAMAVVENGRVVGTITREDLARAQLRRELATSHT
jgi:Zn-dependent protease/CBS domain-containing protein